MMPAASRAQRPQLNLWLSVIALLLVPLIQIASNPAWIYTLDGFIDAWLYHGYFLHLRQYIVAFGAYYYGTRLAWILPGYIAHSVFSPLAANIALRLYVYWMALLSTFFLIRRSYGIRCALIASLLLCSCAGFLSAAGTDYVDGAGVAYLLLCVEELGAAAVLFRHSNRSAVWRSVFAGIAYAAAIHANVFVLVFLPVLAFLLLGRTGLKGSVMALPAAAGFILLTACLGVINLLLGGRFLFFVPSLSAGVGLLSSKNPWYLSPSQWVPTAWWLILPFGVGVANIAFLLRQGVVWWCKPLAANSRLAGITQTVDQASLPFAIGIFIVLTAAGSPVLQLPQYASYLIVFLAVATGALMGRRLDPWPSGGFLTLCGICGLLALVIGTGMFARLPSSLNPVHSLFLGPPPISAVWLVIALAAGIAAADYIRNRALSIVVAAFLIGIVMIHVGQLHEAPGKLRLTEWLGGERSRELYLDTDGISRDIGYITQGKPLWLWYSFHPGDDKDYHYTSLASTFFWGMRLLNWPDTTGIRFDGLHRGSYVAIMDDREDVREEVVTALKRGGVTLRPVKQYASPIGNRVYAVSLLQVMQLDKAPKAYSASPSKETVAPVVELMNYDVVGLLQHAAHVSYGRSPARARSLPAGIFQITDAKDHFATPFQTLPNGGAGPISAVQVTIIDERPPGEFGPVNMVFQDESYRSLYWSGTLPNGRDTTMVSLPLGTQAIRVAFLANDEGYIKFPQFVQLYGFRSK